jgi:hypothetical protein
MFRDLFSQNEWENLEMSVIWMFQAIAGADKKIDVHELDALTFVQANAHKLESELLKEILSSVKYNAEYITSFNSFEQREIKSGLRAMAELLAKKLNPNDSLIFKKSLLTIGMYIAFASGDVLSSKMSNEESQTIVELALHMKINISQYREEPTVQQLLLKFVK